MKRIVLAVAVATLSLSLGNVAQAKERGHKGHGHKKSGYKGRGHRGHGHKGYSRKGYGHRGYARKGYGRKGYAYKGYGRKDYGYRSYKVRNYYKTYGKTFKYGYYYSGRHHRQWVKRYYSRQWRTACYWCPSTSVWYYWYAPKACYYPVSCLKVYPPTPGEEPADLAELPEAPEGEAPDLPNGEQVQQQD